MTIEINYTEPTIFRCILSISQPFINNQDLLKQPPEVFYQKGVLKN